MSNITDFLEYWQNSRDIENTRHIAAAYHDAVADVETSRAQTLKFIQPVRGSKVAWAVGFSPDKFDQVSALAEEIESKEAKLKAICDDIEAFLALAEGKPTFARVAALRANAKIFLNQTKRNGLAIPDEEKATQEAILAEMSDKLSKINSIVDRYEHH